MAGLTIKLTWGVVDWITGRNVTVARGLRFRGTFNEYIHIGSETHE